MRDIVKEANAKYIDMSKVCIIAERTIEAFNVAELSPEEIGIVCMNILHFLSDVHFTGNFKEVATDMVESYNNTIIIGKPECEIVH